MTRAPRWGLLAVLLGAAPLAAQRPITVTGVQGLGFGAVLPGVSAVVSRTDPARSGQFNLAGPHLSQVQLSFTLPLVMAGPAGATMPLVFGGSDAGYSQTQSIGSQIGFDPRLPFVATLSQQGRGSVYLGGTAQPAATQPAGAYTATITLTVAAFP